MASSLVLMTVDLLGFPARQLTARVPGSLSGTPAGMLRDSKASRMTTKNAMKGPKGFEAGISNSMEVWRVFAQ